MELSRHSKKELLEKTGKLEKGNLSAKQVSAHCIAYCPLPIVNYTQNSVKHLRWRFLRNNYFHKKFHLRCWTGFWICFCIVDHAKVCLNTWKRSRERVIGFFLLKITSRMKNLSNTLIFSNNLSNTLNHVYASWPGINSLHSWTPGSIGGSYEFSSVWTSASPSVVSFSQVWLIIFLRFFAWS